jgi:hypothetical protein
MGLLAAGYSGADFIEGFIRDAGDSLIKGDSESSAKAVGLEAERLHREGGDKRSPA